MTVYNPLNEFFKSHTGAICAGEEITFRTFHQGASCVLVVCEDNSEVKHFFKMEDKGGYFETTAKFSTGLYWYYFELGWNNFIVPDYDLSGTYCDNHNRCYQLTVYDKGYTTPQWLKGGIIYQIFPDRFYKSNKNAILTDRYIHKNWEDTPIFMPDKNGIVRNNDFFGGNFQGIIEKLDYLKSLNVTAIYLNPIFKANSNHRYDTGDYFKIDELLGTEEDFEELIAEADKKGIKIILDGVFNHTGDDSLYFNKYGNYGKDGAYNNKDSEFTHWYKFIKYPNVYESWWGIDVLPATNKDDPSFINFITGFGGVLEYYTKKGIGGWRIDVVDELPAHFVVKMREAVKTNNKNAVIIGEVWEDATNKIAYGVRRKYFQGKELDSVMNYPLKTAIIGYVNSGNSNFLAHTVREQIDHYPKFVLDSLMNILSTHDTYRIISSIGATSMLGKSKYEMSLFELSKDEYENAKKKEKIAALLQFTLYGVPSVYYGDEIGMQGCSDPLNRKGFTWGKEDEELLAWYRLLGDIRTQYSAFVDGDVCNICEKNGLFCFARTCQDSAVFIATNVGTTPEKVSFDGQLKDLITGKVYQGSVTLVPYACCILVNQ